MRPPALDRRRRCSPRPPTPSSALVEIFNYWLQPGRIDVGFLGAAQIDRFANINTTVIGDSTAPRVRLPGAGGAPEIAASCREVIVVMRQSREKFVERVDFVTSVGLRLRAPATASASASTAAARESVITDLGILEPDPETRELVLTHLHPGVTVDEATRRDGLGARASRPSSRADASRRRPTELAALRELEQTKAGGS